MNKAAKYNLLYMDLAERIAKMSHARRLQVGSLLVKDNNIISFGWNGMPSGWDNNCEDEIISETGEVILKSKPEVLHSEQNTIAKLSKSTSNSEGSTLYITHAPCLTCAKFVYQAGITKVYYKYTYRSTEGIDFLKKCEVEIHKLNDNGEIIDD